MAANMAKQTSDEKTQMTALSPQRSSGQAAANDRLTALSRSSAKFIEIENYGNLHCSA